jgi:hypothetical protein
MLERARNIRVLGGILALGVPLIASAGVRMQGGYHGQLGHVHFETDAYGHVLGRYGLGGPCGFEARRPVVDGVFQGNVLVGSVTVCQTGPACEERTYPILGFYHPEDGALVADVKLDPGCDSPGLSKRRLILQLARPEDGQSALGPDGQVALASLKKKLPRRTQQKQCEVAFGKAAGLLERHDYAGAVYYFEQALACGEMWVLYQGIGVAELNRNAPEAAMAALEKARELSREAGQEDAQIHYNLACAYVRIGDKASALRALGRAVDLGFADPTQLATDKDLQPLREDAEFKQIVDRAWSLKDRQRGKGQP